MFFFISESALNVLLRTTLYKFYFKTYLIDITYYILQDAHSAELSLNPNFQKKNQTQRPLHQVDALATPFVKQLLKMALAG